jgi:hypothetical protein
VNTLTIKKRKWSDQQKSLARKRKAVLKKTEGLAGT